jgi:hypothetical protein
MTVAADRSLHADRELDARRAGTLASLRGVMSDADMAGVERCTRRLHAALADPARPGDHTVMVAYGGGKDSSYMLAFVRAIQLTMAADHGTTFRLRSVTNRHAGMPQAVMDNIDRAYAALGFEADPDCEALLVDGDEVKAFRRDEPVPAAVVRRNRQDILMTAHRTFAEARPTFCNACNLSMMNAFGLAAAHGGGVDVVITGDSPSEQRAYYMWVSRLARRFGTPPAGRPGRAGFERFLETVDDLAGAYFTDIYGPDAREEVEARRVAHDLPRPLIFFSIFDDTEYSSSTHWSVLTDFLGFEFDELAFSFTETDCGNPSLMAHLRALRCERLYERTYPEGLQEYVEFALGLMRRKEFPPWLVESMAARFADDDAPVRMRAKANAFAMAAYGLTEEQLICMVYSPVAGKGERLAQYLDREQPALARQVEEVHALLCSEREPEGDRATRLSEALQEMSGLDLASLRTLYRSSTLTLTIRSRQRDLLGAILAGDPHKESIETRHRPNGPVVHELLSGR